MCPDDQILSTYYDGELNINWSERIDAHLKECTKCRDKISVFSKLSTGLNSIDLSCVDESKACVMNRIKKNRLPVISPPFWKLRLNLSIPVAAAAGFAIFLFSFSLSSFIRPNPSSTYYAKSSSKYISDIKKFTREELIKYLNSEDSSVEVKIKLPENSDIEVTGEPELIRFVEYNRGE